MRRWLDRWQPSESILLGGMALVVGLFSGAGVWVFQQMFEFAHEAAFVRLGDSLAGIGKWTILLVPLVGVGSALMLP